MDDPAPPGAVCPPIYDPDILINDLINETKGRQNLRRRLFMASINFEEIEYAELLTFMTVAKTLNMSVAAEKLCVTQPAVSKRIANIENRYGIILFIRSGRKLQMTPAGKAFYYELLKSFEHLNKAFVDAAQVQAEPLRVLRLAYDRFFDIPLLYEIVHRFSCRYPRVRVYLYSYYEEDCMDLFNGKADIMICPEIYTELVPSRVAHENISAYQFCVLMSKDHWLANRSSITVPELMGVPLTVARIEEKSPYLTAIRRIFSKYGISPRFEHLVQRENLLFSLMTDNGVAIASPSFWHRLNARTAAFYEGHMVSLPLEDELLPVSLIWRADESQEDVMNFLKVYHEVLAEPGNQEILDQAYN